MFEEDGVTDVAEPWWLTDVARSLPRPDAVLPQVPAWLEEEPADWLERAEAAWDADLATMTPQERFELEVGGTPTCEQLEAFAPATLERAVALQDRAVEAFRVRALADARRIDVLLVAHDASIADLMKRFGPQVGDANGMGGSAFSSTVALLTRTDPREVTHEIRAGLTLRDRLPETWAVLQAGLTTWARAKKAVAQADGLAAEHWTAYDGQAARIVQDSTRVKHDLRRARERLQDDTAAERARTTWQRRTTTVEAGPDSGAALVIDGLATDWVPRGDALHRLAVAAHGVDPEHRTVSQLRHDIARRIFDLGLDAFQVSAAAGGEVVPARTKVEVQLILTVPALSWLGRTREQARIAGFGPVPMELAKALAGSATSFIRVLTDPITGARLAMDRTARKPPTDLARWVRIRDGRTRFPGKGTPAHLSDIDHAREWQDDGFTNEDNLIVLDRPSHNAKSAGLYTDELLDTGGVAIVDPWGHRFEDPPDDPLDPAPPDLLTEPPPPDDACPFRPLGPSTVGV